MALRLQNCDERPDLQSAFCSRILQTWILDSGTSRPLPQRGAALRLAEGGSAAQGAVGDARRVRAPALSCYSVIEHAPCGAADEAEWQGSHASLHEQDGGAGGAGGGRLRVRERLMTRRCMAWHSRSRCLLRHCMASAFANLAARFAASLQFEVAALAFQGCPLWLLATLAARCSSRHTPCGPCRVPRQGSYV